MVQQLFPVVEIFAQNLQSTPYLGVDSKVPLPLPPEMKIVRDFRYEVAQIGLAKYSPPPPPPENSKIADLDLVFKVGWAKYPPNFEQS